MEKTLNELGDKVSAEEKSDIQTKISALREAGKSGTVEDIKARQDELQKAFYAVSEKLYQQAQPQGGQPGPDMGGQPGGSTPNDDGTIDADFHEV